MSVKDARAQAREYWLIPPRFEAKASTGTFKEVAENSIRRYVDLHRLRSKPEILRILNKYVYPEWADRPFLEIRRGEVNKLLDKVIDATAPRKGAHPQNQRRSQADGILAVTRGIMTWHQSRDEDYVSPIVKGMRRHKSKPRDRILSDDEIRALWIGLDDFPVFGPIVKLCLLTAQRSRKIASMRWEESEKDGVWLIPAGRPRKGHRAFFATIAIGPRNCPGAPHFRGNPYVFASRPSKHFNAWSQSKSGLDNELKKVLPDMQSWTIHDLRRTARSPNEPRWCAAGHCGTGSRSRDYRC